jgi:polyisoprenyl-teichoic acid--peptidoglycan teichoic acid transferase
MLYSKLMNKYGKLIVLFLFAISLIIVIGNKVVGLATPPNNTTTQISSRVVTQSPSVTPRPPQLISPTPTIRTTTPLPTSNAIVGGYQESKQINKFTQTPPIPTPYPTITNEDGESLKVTWEEYPAPSSWPSHQVPPPLNSIGDLPDVNNLISILLLGNDYRPKMGTRTDSIMLLVLNLETKKANLLSIPRDLYVYAPGMTMMKINTIQPIGSYDLLFDTFKYNFGIRPDYYINISRDAIIEVIDILGGIDVYVKYALDDPVFANGDYSVEPGWMKMDGATARWYVSSRITTTDFSRNLRQQAVLEGMFNQLMTINAVNEIPEFYNLFSEKVRSNLNLEDLFQFVPIALEINNYKTIEKYAIQSKDVESTYTPVSHAFIFIPNIDNIFDIMNAVLSP